jgi:methylated-DNA-[protein]-cysteine S-methyltransferase
MEVIHFTAFPTPYGPMIAAASARGVCRLLPPGQTMDDLVRWLARHAPAAELVPDERADRGLRTQVPEYLAGLRRTFTVPLDLRGTPFQRAVWQAVCAIPYGQTCSYADIARAVGRPGAWRAVGAANAVNPVCLVIPCHRVIGADGTLKGYAGGVLNRRLLLAIERGRRPRSAVATDV